MNCRRKNCWTSHLLRFISQLKVLPKQNVKKPQGPPNQYWVKCLLGSATPDSEYETDPEMRHQKPGDATPIWQCYTKNPEMPHRSGDANPIRRCHTNPEMRHWSGDVTPIQRCNTNLEMQLRSGDAAPKTQRCNTKNRKMQQQKSGDATPKIRRCNNNR